MWYSRMQKWKTSLYRWILINLYNKCISFVPILLEQNSASHAIIRHLLASFPLCVFTHTAFWKCNWELDFCSQLLSFTALTQKLLTDFSMRIVPFFFQNIEHSVKFKAQAMQFLKHKNYSFSPPTQLLPLKGFFSVLFFSFLLAFISPRQEIYGSWYLQTPI